MTPGGQTAEVWFGVLLGNRIREVLSGCEEFTPRQVVAGKLNRPQFEQPGST